MRIKRYNLIYKHLYFDEILLTGHHLNDQCETLILALKRGSGPTGISGMSKKNNLGEKKIIRPLLKETKKELKKWAQKNNLTWIKDFSNYNINHDRNFIRHKIIPILEKRWPFFLRNCFRTTTICKQEVKLKNIFLEKKIKNFINSSNDLNIKKFNQMPKEIVKELIRYWILSKNVKAPSYKIIKCIYKEVIFSKKDANPKIIIQKNTIRRYKNFLYFIKNQEKINNILLFWHDTEKKINLPNNLGYLVKNNQGIKIPAPKKSQLINIRFQHEGKILILGRDKRRKMKKIWQEHNVPPWFRNQIPLLFYDDYFISALGIFTVINEKKYKNSWRISWINKIKNNNSFLFY